jgi:Predicted membrane protein
LTNKLLRNPLIWAITIAASLITFLVAACYLEGFLNPENNTRDLPILVANEDHGDTLNGKYRDLGDEIVTKIINTNSTDGNNNTAIAWTQVPTRQEAINDLNNDQYYAAIIIPSGYTSNIADLTNMQNTASKNKPVQIEVLQNAASGSISSQESLTVATGAAEKAVQSVLNSLPAPKAAPITVSQPTAQQMQLMLQQLAVNPQGVLQAQAAAAAKQAAQQASQQTQLIAEIKGELQQSILPKVTNAEPVGSKSGRGLGSFYFALMLALTGYLGATIIHLGVEFVSGRMEVDLLALNIKRPYMEVSRTRQWATKMLMICLLAAIAAPAITWLATQSIGMPVSDGVKLGWFSVLSIAGVGLFTLIFITAFGEIGALIGLFLSTIVGVPAAGGVYPLQMVPDFFRFMSNWVPLRFISDGTRSLVFFDGRLDAGLGTACWSLAIYAILGLCVSFVIAAGIDVYKSLKNNVVYHPQAQPQPTDETRQLEEVHA